MHGVMLNILCLSTLCSEALRAKCKELLLRSAQSEGSRTEFLLNLVELNPSTLLHSSLMVVQKKNFTLLGCFLLLTHL
jgi:hypothetical protein